MNIVASFNCPAQCDIMFVIQISESLYPHFVFLGINVENNQLCGVYSWFIETKVKNTIKTSYVNACSEL